MKKAVLLSKLANVNPARATTDIVPIMTHFCFTGTHLFTYSDRIALAVPCKLPEFKGAVPGEFYKLVETLSGKKELELVTSDNELKVKSGASSIRLSTLPTEDFIFDVNAYRPGEKGLPIKLSDFITKIDLLLRSCVPDSPQPEKMGVTMIPHDGYVDLYSVNDATLSFARIDTKKPLIKERVILSHSFCREMSRLFHATEGKCQLEIREDHALFVADDVWLYGRLFAYDSRYDFDSVARIHLPDQVEDLLRPIPSRFAACIERAVVVTDLQPEGMVATFKVRDGKLRIHSKSGRIEVSDVMSIEHPDVAPIKLEPRLLKNGLSDFDRLCFTDRCCVMAKAGLGMYLVTTK